MEDRATDNCHIINVYVYRLRKELARHGIVDAIITERGRYSIAEYKALTIMKMFNRNYDMDIHVPLFT